MPTKFFYGLFVGVLVVMISGCTGSSAVRTRAYVDEKERVDQEMQGNFGYLVGQPVVEDRSQYKKTRKIYVLEVAKIEDVEEEETQLPPRRERKPVTLNIPERKPRQQVVNAPAGPPDIVLPSFENGSYSDAPAERSQPLSGGSFIDYTVQKNDTLQKISKKFYDTYRKWPQIYEANRDLLENPDAISPGLVIRIPTE